MKRLVFSLLAVLAYGAYFVFASLYSQRIIGELLSFTADEAAKGVAVTIGLFFTFVCFTLHALLRRIRSYHGLRVFFVLILAGTLFLFASHLLLVIFPAAADYLKLPKPVFKYLHLT
jgi:hypothetical protein